MFHIWVLNSQLETSSLDYVDPKSIRNAIRPRALQFRIQRQAELQEAQK
jgi:hypothetical protein